MPLPITMLDARTKVRQRADMTPTGGPISDVEMNGIISEVFGCDLYECAVRSGFRYFETTQDYTTTSGYIAEPDDQLCMTDHLELLLDPVNRRSRRLFPIQAQEHTKWSNSGTGDPLVYELVDGRFFLWPKPPDGKTITLRYTYQPPDLTNYLDTQTIDVVSPSGLVLLMYMAAAVALAKTNRDNSFQLARAEQARTKFEDILCDRLANDTTRWIPEDDVLGLGGYF